MENISLLEKIENIAKRFKGNTAIKTTNSSYTYQRLHEMANTLGSSINSKLKKSSKLNVGLLFDHDEDMVNSILACIKSKKTYVPLNTSFPAKRLVSILQDSESKLVLTNSKNYEFACELLNANDLNFTILNVDETKEDINVDTTCNKSEDAMIIYTSGSTGQPKGVTHSYNSVCQSVNSFVRELAISEQDNVLLTTSCSHVVSILDIFGALTTGATISIYDLKKDFDIDSFISWYSKADISIIHSVPTFFRYFINNVDDYRLLLKNRLVILGGESLNIEDFKLYKDNFPDNSYFINCYGMSEVLLGTINVLNKESNLERDTIPIGYPIDELKAYILNEEDIETNVYETGEIVFESDILTTRYNNIETQTNELYDRYRGKKILRTGDLAKRLPDGSIDYQGRKDFQFKLQGNRINPAEIETALNSIEPIHQSLVKCITSQEEQSYIVAYYTTSSKEQISNENFISALSNILPEYMIPVHYIYLHNFPLGETGKIDRDRLPDVTYDFKEIENEEIVEELRRIWIDVFSTDKIEYYDNFFQLGGNSLIARKVLNKINDTFQIELFYKDLYAYPTINELNNVIKKSLLDDNISAFRNGFNIPKAEKQEYYSVSDSQKRMLLSRESGVHSGDYKIPNAFEVLGDIKKDTIENIFIGLISRHEVLRTVFKKVNIEYKQFIVDENHFELECQKLDSINNEDEINENLENIWREFIKDFDLNKAPLMRAKLISITENRHVILVDIDHVIIEKSTYDILINDFNYFLNKEKLPDVPITFIDYTYWQKKRIESGLLDNQEKYWLAYYSGKSVPKLNLPTDYKRSDRVGTETRTVDFEIDNRLTNEINDFCVQHNSTVNIFLLAVYGAFLHKLTRQEDIVIGVPVSTRPSESMENLVGIFLNILPIRLFPRSKESFRKYFDESKESILNAYKNQDYPFNSLIEKLNVKRELNRTILFDTVFNSQATSKITENNLVTKDGILFRRLNLKSEAANYDIEIKFIEVNNTICFRCTYRNNLFQYQTMKNFMNGYLALIKLVIKNPDDFLSNFKIFQVKSSFEHQVIAR